MLTYIKFSDKTVLNSVCSLSPVSFIVSNLCINAANISWSYLQRCSVTQTCKFDLLGCGWESDASQNFFRISKSAAVTAVYEYDIGHGLVEIKSGDTLVQQSSRLFRTICAGHY